MAIYNKQKLHSLQAIKQEKQRLKLELSRMNEAGLFSLKDLDAASDRQSVENQSAGLLGTVNGLLTSPTVLDSALALGIPLLRFLPQKTQKSILRSFVREFFGGYLKWKGMSVGFRILRSLLKSKK